MSKDTNDTKTTLYLSPTVRRALKRRVIETGQTMSAYADRALAIAIAEDLEDIEDAESRRNEPTESFDEFVKALKKDGLL